MKKIILLTLLLSAPLLNSCTDKEGATKALERNGYKPIEVGGYGFFVETDDKYITKFKAVAVNGDTVTGVVTKSFFKGSTIRLDD